MQKYQVLEKLNQAYPDVDPQDLDSLVETYIRCVAREFKSSDPYVWIEPKNISWAKLRDKCGVFISKGYVLTVLDAFHKVAPLMAIIRQNSTFEKFSVSAIMLYPELISEHIKRTCLLGLGDARYLKTRDLLIDIYVNGPAFEAVQRLKPGQARRMIASDRACVD